MPKARTRYSLETKAKIVESVVAARETDSWKDAHAGEQKIGYIAELQNLRRSYAQ